MSKSHLRASKDLIGWFGVCFKSVRVQSKRRVQGVQGKGGGGGGRWCEEGGQQKNSNISAYVICVMAPSTAYPFMGDPG